MNRIQQQVKAAVADDMMLVSDELTQNSKELIEKMIKIQFEAVEENLQKTINRRFDELAKQLSA